MKAIDAVQGGHFESFGRDIRYAWRTLRRAPGFSLSIVATLALGIAAATSVLSVAYAILLRPLPVHDQDRVLVLWADNPTHSPAHLPLAQRDRVAFARDSKTLESVAAYEFNGAWPQFIQIGDTSATVDNALVTGNYFDVLGVRPILGRLLHESDDVPGAPPVIVLGETFWRNTLGGDSSIVGRRVRIVGNVATVAGVAPRGFNLPGEAQSWIPLSAYAAMTHADSGGFAMDLVGRMRAGVSIEQVSSEFREFLHRPYPSHGGLILSLGARLRPAVARLANVIIGDVRPVLLVVTAAGLLLLLVTCVSAANLLIVRSLAREREIAVRVTLGAGRWRVARQLLAESAIVTAASVAVGVALAFVALKIFAVYAPANLPRSDEFAIDARVLLAIATACGAVMIGVSLVPLLGRSGGSRDNISDLLRGRSGGERRASALARRVLVTTQVAVSVCALVCAGLFVRSFIALGQQQLGFNPENVVFARVAPAPSGVETAAQIETAIDEIVRRVSQLPGVVSATPTLSRPFARAGGWEFPYALPGDSPSTSRANRPMFNVFLAGPTYFETMGTRLIAGRTFSAQDDEHAPGAVIIEASVARALWPGESAIGKRIGVGRQRDLQTVIGVVEDTRYRDLRTARLTAYLPLKQFTLFAPGFIAVRVRGDLAPIERALRGVVADVDRGIFLPSITTLEQLTAEPLATPKLNAVLLIAFAISIASLAAIGLYALLSAGVRARRFELAVRLALGAEPRAVATLVLNQGVRVLIIGGAIGLVAAFIGAQLISSVTYGVSASDPLTFAAAITVVTTIVALASWLPARRAARVNPSDALRGE
jgi:putative ABC transport system permease protein